MVLFDSAVYNFITNIFIVTDYRWVFFFKMATTLGNTIKWHAASAAINGVSRSVQ